MRRNNVMPEFDIEMFEFDSTMDSVRDVVIKDNLNRRVIVINNDIKDEVLEEYILLILKWNLEDKNIPKNKRKPIFVYINSCGGDVFAAMNFIDIIESSTTPVYGVAFSLVASAAFLIYVVCKKRYAFKNSVLLMHDGEISISNSSSKAKDTMNFVDAMEDREREIVLSNTSMTDEFFDENHRKETYMYANTEGREYGCVDYIIGENATMDDIV